MAMQMGPGPTPAPPTPGGGQTGPPPGAPPPPGMMPPPAAAMAPPPPPVAPPPLVDVASTLPHGIQLCDFSVRYLRKAAASMEFVREPVHRAEVLGVIEDIEKIISAMSEKGGKGMAAENPMAPGGDEDEGTGDAPEPEESSDE